MGDFIKFDTSPSKIANNNKEPACLESSGCTELELKVVEGESVFISKDEHAQFIPDDGKHKASFVQCNGKMCFLTKLELPASVALKDISAVQMFDTNGDGIKDIVVRMKDGAMYLYRGINE